jgi:hypothetical protein
LEVIAKVASLTHKVNPRNKEVGSFELSVYPSVTVGDGRRLALRHSQRFIFGCLYGFFIFLTE